MITCIDTITLLCELTDLPEFTTLEEFIQNGGSVSDNCSIDTLSFTHIGDLSDDNDCAETIIRTYMISDLCGNTNICTQTIIVNDEELPEFINTPSDQTIDCEDSIPVFVLEAIDNCDTNITISRADSTSTQTFNGTSTDVCFEISRTWIATDNCGNVDSFTHLSLIHI